MSGDASLKGWYPFPHWAAAAKATDMGMVTISRTGHEDGKIARSADLDHCLVLPGDSIRRIQEAPMVTRHIIRNLVHSLLAAQRGGPMDQPP